MDATDLDRLLGQLIAAEVNPRQSLLALTGALRSVGWTGSDAEARSVVRVYQLQSGMAEEHADTVSRQHAARALGVCIQRVDQLRRQGRLEWRTSTFTKQTLIEGHSLRAMLAYRRRTSLGQRHLDGLRRWAQGEQRSRNGLTLAETLERRRGQRRAG